ncbi:DUF6252 family protein [Aquimarina intermedia]|uniref:Uncharacterized protein n=1 Tax=Aquimarina intermedia TaxID=350814 RepID=A0A5S5CCX5_9FLAO|nr:DUF6252 family protein [Aquimarina intermedia]TYP77231.1 hypothetical protein BD809_101383 [Aquimarina intermedia]
MINKTTFLLFCLISTLLSCSNDIEVNTPGLQVAIDGELFISDIKEATLLDDGTIIISGSAGNKSLTITIPSSSVGSYKLDDQTHGEVAYTDASFKFLNKSGESSGTTTITNRTDNTISGTFNFINLKDEYGNAVTFQNGWFYRIPLIPGTIPTPETSEEEIAINPCLLNASMTGLIDLTEFIGDTHEAVIIGVEDASLRITATNDDEVIELVVPIDVVSGEYSLSGSGQYSATYSLNKDKSAAQSGSITITNHDTTTRCVNGTFTFATRNQHEITEGTFDFGY